MEASTRQEGVEIPLPKTIVEINYKAYSQLLW